MGIWGEWRGFFREFRTSFRTTGAVLPSSRFLAQALARPIRASRPPARILEVGPGTGAVTRAIARNMLPDDRLDCVEINERFVDLLKERIARGRAFDPCREQIEVIHAPVESLIGESVYDYIISGLPLNNFTAAQAREIFLALKRLIKPNGVLSYFEYLGVRRLKRAFVASGERWRLLRLGCLVERYLRDYEVGRERVFLNVPPAMARRLVLKPSDWPALHGSSSTHFLLEQSTDAESSPM